jgi:hypothetical protein
MQLVEVDVLLDDGPSTRAAHVLDELRRLGLQDAHLLPTLGVVHGRVEPSDIHALAAVRGVRSVERARAVHAAVRSM